MVCWLKLLRLGTTLALATRVQPGGGYHPPRATLEKTGPGSSTWQGLLSPNWGSSCRGNRASGHLL